MALGILFLIFVGMCMLALVGIGLMFWVKKQPANDIIMVLLMVFSLVIAYLSAGANPTNFVTARIIAWVVGLVAVVGVGVRMYTKEQTVLGKLLVAGSVIAGIYGLYFG